jgi:SWI/SNF-related matrix-associated actin-dependent regulator 1 of chromatin subfamily A
MTLRELYPYQTKGVEHLRYRRRGYLADEMGLGKTVQALVALKTEASLTVVCPASAISNWEREIERWWINGETRRSRVVSYASLHKVQPEPNAVILDEAHYVKSPKAKRTQRALALAANAKKAVLLSGTPMPNHPGELFSVIKALWPECIPPKLRTHYRWMMHFCLVRQTRYGMKVYGHKNAQELRGIVGQFMLRRKLADVALDLPPLRIDLDRLPAVPELVDRIPEDSLKLLHSAMQQEEAKDDPSTSRLRRLLGMAKVPYIAKRIADELDDKAYQKIVVMYYHRDVGDYLYDALKDFGVVRVDGRTVDRGQAIQDFNHGSPRVFLGQQVAAGEALNLQAASEIVLIEPAWTPDLNLQAIKRIHRIGQDHPCRARVFAVADSLDEAVMQTVARKTRTQIAVGLD